MKTAYILVVIAVVAVFVSADLSPRANAQAPADSRVKRVKGSVKWFNDIKGIGFITSEGGEAVFFDKAAAKGRPFEGECVTFEIKSSPKGPVAKRVRKCPRSTPLMNRPPIIPNAPLDE